MKQTEFQMCDYETIIKMIEYTDKTMRRRQWWRFVDNWKLLLLQIECGQKVSMHIFLNELFLGPRMSPVEDFFETVVRGSFNEKREKTIVSRDRFEYVDDSKSSDHIEKNHIIQWKEN